jgi:DNA-binding response OmpR family regulator
MADLLLVDNDARLSELMAWFLERHGHQVRTACSYVEARARIAERRPDLMLADLELGRENGREELPRMAQLGCLPRTLVVSGYVDRESEAGLSALPLVVGMLRKPFELDRLEALVRAGVGGASSTTAGGLATPRGARAMNDRPERSLAADGGADA